MDIKNQSFLILGASKSGLAVANYLLDNKCNSCYIYEQLSNEQITKNLESLKTKGVVVVKENEILEILEKIAVLVVSPGVPINHPLCVKAKEMNKRIMGELEFGFNAFIPPIIAVTGTNGKTTTVSLIDQIFKKTKTKSFLLGNVGVPLTREVLNIEKQDVCVLEVSSFQLEGTKDFYPHVSCVLNISPDHLDRHYTMENYVFLKKKIFSNQKQSEYCVLNYDDPIVNAFSSEVKAKVVWVSTKEKVDGAYLFDGKLYYKGEFIIDEIDLPILGIHNVYNALFAIACVKLFGVDTESVRGGLTEFKGIKNRLELIGEVGGVKYVNDSKATNTASTITALNSTKGSLILILGGSEKGEDYSLLFEKIKEMSIKHVLITGDSRYKMYDKAVSAELKNVTLTSTFELAVKVASMSASEGDTVLLSPACASFDEFSSYEERGEKFKAIVEEFSEKFNR